MEPANTVVDQAFIDKTYAYAANLMVNQKKSAEETKSALVAGGLDMESATIVVDNLEVKIHSARKDRAKKDMLYGALWCVGGIVGTAAQVGFIFWGAIIFGGIQFFKGVANMNG